MTRRPAPPTSRRPRPWLLAGAAAGFAVLLGGLAALARRAGLGGRPAAGLPRPGDPARPTTAEAAGAWPPNAYALRPDDAPASLSPAAALDTPAVARGGRADRRAPRGHAPAIVTGPATIAVPAIVTAPARARRPRVLAGARPAGPILGAAAVLLAAVAVNAHWTAGGSGSGAGGASTLGVPSVVASGGAGIVALSWTAVSPPGGGTARYYVTRDGGAPAGDCPTSAATATVLTCTDSGLVRGTYAYTVTAVFNTWTATSSPPASVTLASGAMDHYVLAVASPTLTAGGTDDLTVTASDAAGHTVTAWTGAHSLVFAGASAIGGHSPTVTNAAGTQVAFGSATSLTFSSGVATVSGSANGVLRLYKAETASITVSEGGAYGSAAVTVTVSGAGIASFAVATPASQTAGSPFSVSLTAKDTYGNTATYAGTKCVTFSGPASSPNGTAPSYPARGACGVGASSLSFTAGTATASITLAKAASTTLTATDAASGSTGATGSFTVAAAAMSKLSLAAASTTPTAGTADNLTITAIDAYGNTVTGYTGSHSLTFAGATSPVALPATVTNSAGVATSFGSATAISFTSGVASVSGSNNGVMRLYKAETASITVAEGGNYTSAALSVTVAPAGINSFTVATPSAQVAAIAFSLSITAKDAYGNAAAYTGTQCVTFSGPATSPDGTAPTYPARGACAVGQSAVTFSAGAAATPSVTLPKAATTTITVTDAATGKAGSSSSFTVAVGALSRFYLVAATVTPNVGEADALTVTATDAGGNTITTYTGSHALTFAGGVTSGSHAPTVTSAAGSAVTFGSSTSLTFTAGVAAASGGLNGSMTLYRVGAQSITVTDGTHTSAALAVTPALPAGLGMTGQHRNYDLAAPNDNQVKPGITLLNTGSIDALSAAITVRYWFSGDGGSTSYGLWCDYALVGCPALLYTIVAVSPARSGNDAYLELAALDTGGSLPPGGSSGEVQLRFSKADWSVFNETNDWSYTTNATFADASHLTIYWYGNLIWGTEP